MKTSTLFTTYFAASLAFCSCGDPNEPVQTASEYGTTNEDTAGALSGAGATANKQDSTINNAEKKDLPDQMVPENSSAISTTSSNPN